MRINAEVTILFDHDGLKIEVNDVDAGISFLELRLNQEQTCRALSRSSNTTCELAEVWGLEHVGKTREHEMFEFQLPAGTDLYNRDKRAAITEIDRVCPLGWKADHHFSSQGSFFTKDDQPWARTTIRRWVEKTTVGA
jgi:hypothetical protein